MIFKCLVGALSVSLGISFSIDGACSNESAISQSMPGAKIERLPITGMVKVSQPDGETYFISQDRRFVFKGEMFDLWTGEALTAGIEVEQRIDWDRNGVSIQKIGFPVGNSETKRALFIAPECQDCKDLLRVVIDKFSGINIVLLASSEKGLFLNKLIWCSKDRTEALKTIYLDGMDVDSKNLHQECDQFGLMMADQAAKLFGIGQLPMYVDENGMGYTGERAIHAVLK